MNTADLKIVRARLKDQRRSLNPDFVASASYDFGKIFWQQRFAQRAKNIGVYMSTAGEIDCSRIIESAWLRKKRIFAPILKGRKLIFAALQPDTKLTTNRFGILEPVYTKTSLIPLPQLDIVIVPLLAFDDSLNRLGMGAGYYDRSFAFVKQRRNLRHPLLTGAAYSFQHIPDTQAKPWDVPLHVVITEKECIGSR